MGGSNSAIQPKSQAQHDMANLNPDTLRRRLAEFASADGVTVCAGLRGHKDSVNTLDGSSEWQCILSGSDDGTARLWDVRTMKAQRCCCVPRGEEVLAVALGSHKENAAFAATPAAVFQYDLRRPDLILREAARSVDEFNDEIGGLYYHSGLLAVCDDAGEVVVLDTSRGDESGGTSDIVKARFRGGHNNVCGGVVILPDTMELEVLSCGLDCCAVWWTADKGETRCLQRMEATSRPTGNQTVNPPFFQDIDIASDGKEFVLGCGDSCLRLYRQKKLTGKQKKKKGTSHKWDLAAVLEGPASAVTAVCYGELGSRRCVASASQDKMVAVWDINALDDANVDPTDPLSILSGSLRSLSRRFPIQGGKPNSVTTVGHCIYVATTSSDIEVYELHPGA